MINSLVSILIPCYNSEKYIIETLVSCINQTYKNIEIIVVDDGSSDKSFEIVKKFSEKTPIVKLYKQENKGAPAARNLAFEKSKGEYIQYLDADDILDTKKIENQMKHIENNTSQHLVYGAIKYFEKDLKNSWDYKPLIKDKYVKTEEFLIELWNSSSSILIHAWLTPRSLIQKVGEWDENILKNQDGVFFAKIAFEANQIHYTQDSIAFCRVDNTNSISRKKSPKSEASRLKSFEEYEKLFALNMTKDISKALAVQYSDFIFNNYPENKDLCKIAHEKIESLGFKEPIYNHIKLYSALSPIFGIYNVIYIHKKLSFLKQFIKKSLRG